jgi:hypothetical protein
MITLLISLGLLSGQRSENDREPDQSHGHLDRGWLPASLVERRDAHQHGDAHEQRSERVSHGPRPG